MMTSQCHRFVDARVEKQNGIYVLCHLLVTITCAHGNLALYPLANVDMQVDGLPVKVEAANTACFSSAGKRCPSFREYRTR